VNRRAFITLLSGTAAPPLLWPLAARSQQTAMPVVGLLSSYAPDLLQAFRQGLKDTGYTERENMAIEYLPAQNQIDRLPEVAAELVHRKVDVIVAGNTSAAFALRPQQSQSFSTPLKTRSRLVLSQASPAPVAI